MNAIVSVTRDWGIGCDGDLLIPNKADMKYFVEHTRGCTVVMGRKTLESFPGGPLKVAATSSSLETPITRSKA